MALILRPTLASAVYRHLEDWAIVEDGRTVGRIIHDGSSSTPPDRRWGWSIVTAGKARNKTKPDRIISSDEHDRDRRGRPLGR
jgi:hypothetical protein